MFESAAACYFGSRSARSQHPLAVADIEPGLSLRVPKLAAAPPKQSGSPLPLSTHSNG